MRSANRQSLRGQPLSKELDYPVAGLVCRLAVDLTGVFGGQRVRHLAQPVFVGREPFARRDLVLAEPSSRDYRKLTTSLPQTARMCASTSCTMASRLPMIRQARSVCW